MDTDTGWFPRWNFAIYRAATETVFSLSTTSTETPPTLVGNSGGGGGGGVDVVESSSQTPTAAIKTVVRVSADSTATATASSCESDSKNSDKNEVEEEVEYIAGFRNNWLAGYPHAVCGAGSSDWGGVTKRRPPVQQPPPPPQPLPIIALNSGDATAARPSSASNSSWGQQQHHRRTGSSFPAWQRHLNSSNTSHIDADDLAAAVAVARPQAAAAPREPAAATRKPVAAAVAFNPRPEELSCLASVTPLRVLGLITYYLLLWTLTGAFTWLLLEVSLLTTGSRGKYPYYMASHSFILTSPEIGFLGGDRNPGDAAEFASLPLLLAKVKAALAAAKTSDSDARNCAGTTATDEETLARPCNLTTFAEEASAKAQDLLTDRPVAIVQVKRHIGYLPASSNVVVTCSATAGGADVPLRYYSWTGAGLSNSTSSGTVSADYFPMLSKRHRVPWVLVSLDTATSAVWINVKVTLRCSASDGGPQRPKRELLLLVKAVGP